MKALRLILPILAAGATASAQDLSTEVVVERTIVPVERAASRPRGLQPRVTLPKATTPAMSTAGYDSPAEITRAIPRLTPVDGALVPESTWRGYVTAGYFPALDAAVSAGYRFVQSQRLTAGAWLHFDNLKYKPVSGDLNPDGLHNRYTAISAGAYMSLRPAERSRLDAAASYRYSSRHLGMISDAQSLSDGRIAVAWTSRLEGLDYHASADVELFSFGKCDLAAEGLSQQHYNIKLGGSLYFDEDARAGVDIEADLQHTAISRLVLPANLAHPTLGVITFTPFVDARGEHYAARAGARINVLPGGTGSRLNVAPDVRLSWMPVTCVALTASAGGGRRLNTMSVLESVSPLLYATTPFDRSRIPFEADLDLTVGPFKGLSVSLFGGFAKADRSLMFGTAAMPLMMCKAKGFHGGIKAAYDSRLVTVEAGAEVAGRGDWYQRRDGARWVVEAGARVRPLAGLEVGLDYTLRSGRLIPAAMPGIGTVVSDLGATARYNFSPRLAVTATVSNLTGRRWLDAPGVANRKLNGLVGVSYLF